MRQRHLSYCVPTEELWEKRLVLAQPLAWVPVIIFKRPTRTETRNESFLSCSTAGGEGHAQQVEKRRTDSQRAQFEEQCLCCLTFTGACVPRYPFSSPTLIKIRVNEPAVYANPPPVVM